MRPRRIALGLLLLGACCSPLTTTEHHSTPGSASGPGPAPAASRPAPAAPSDSSAIPIPAPLAALPWIDAVRVGHWEQAARALDALPAADQAQPEVRYVRARVALAQRDYVRVLVLVEQLEEKLPLLADDIALRRAEAQLHAGSPEKAAQVFQARPSVRKLTKAALAWERAGKLEQAREAIDQAIRLGRRGDRDAAAHARLVRARIAEALGEQQVAISDLRAVVARADDAELSREAAAKLERLDPKRRLTSQDHLERAERLAGRGDTADALEALDQAERAPGAPVPPAQLLKARASALYKGRHSYADAAALYEKAARIDGQHVPECLYFAAKAWTRADQNERGLTLYDELARRFPRSPWAERATYFAARLHRLNARWAIAASAYDNYLKRYRRGGFQQEAVHERALCLLLAGHHQDARRSLTQMARRETNRHEAAAMRYLAAAAAFQGGDKKAAIGAWREAIAEEPLSWFALASAARLRAAAIAPPAPIAPAAPASRVSPLNVRLPNTVQLLRDLGLDEDAEDFLTEHENALVEPYGARSVEARCALYKTLGTGHRRHRVAQRYAPVNLVQAAPSAATRWAWECLYPTPYATMIADLEQREQLPHGLLHAVMRQESGFNPQARSPVGARGLMQLMPRTADRTALRLGLDVDGDAITTPWINLSLGAHYLGMMLRMFEGSVPLAIAAYNAGPVAVGSWLQRSGDIPLDLWVAQIPYRETRHYVWRVMGNVARYRYLARGQDGIPSLELALPKGVAIPPDAY